MDELTHVANVTTASTNPNKENTISNESLGAVLVNNVQRSVVVAPADCVMLLFPNRPCDMFKQLKEPMCS
jgi:hypothetical protein